MGGEKPREMLFWTKEEYLKFSEAMMDKPLSFYAFEMLYWCGIREGELYNCDILAFVENRLHKIFYRAMGKLTSQYGKIGSNLNQIARFLQTQGTPYNPLSEEVRTAISELADLKYQVLTQVGDAVGNVQTYRL